MCVDSFAHLLACFEWNKKVVFPPRNAWDLSLLFSVLQLLHGHGRSRSGNRQVKGHQR